MSRSHANPPRTQDQQGDLDSRPLRDALETLQANTDEMEALRLTNQRLLRDLEELTRQMQRPQEEQRHHDVPREVDGEKETSQAKESDPYKPPKRIAMREFLVGTTKAMDTIMGAAFSRHSIRAHPHEGNCKRTSSSLHGCFGTTNRIPVHGRGTTLPSPCKVQNASDQNFRHNERPYRSPQYLQESDEATRILGPREM